MHQEAHEHYVVLPSAFAPVCPDGKSVWWHAVMLMRGRFPLVSMFFIPTQSGNHRLHARFIAVITGANPANYCQSTFLERNGRVLAIAESSTLTTDLPFSPAAYH
jgi:hypothetical protein